MAQFDKETLELVKKLQGARISLLTNHPFYALLLMHMKFSLDKTCETSYTDGVRIAFNPDYLKELSDSELEFVLMHNVLHAALGHPFRVQTDYNLEIYDKACDIVVNSNILYSFGMDESKITTKYSGEAIHLTPSGEEGYEFTLEEVYDQLMKIESKKKKRKKNNEKGNGKERDKSEADTDDNEETTDCDEIEESEDEKYDEDGIDCDSADDDGEETNGSDKGDDYEETNGEAKELDVESLVEKIKARNSYLSKKYESQFKTNKGKIKVEVEVEKSSDDHSFWQGEPESEPLSDIWSSHTMEATNVILEKEESHVGYGGPPLCAVRLLKELTEPEVDWRTLLNSFVQEEINDYSFSPPDKRMDDCPFFLPDFNEKEDSVKNIWFLIDTSGSIGDREISAAYSEIANAIEVFNNKLEGLLSFTEVFVTEPIPFCSVEEVLEIKPVGGGGNDFGEIFRYMKNNMMDNLPNSIVIFTDGYDMYPDESEAMGIPVLWLLNNKEAEPPKWGKCVRFKVD